MRLLLAALTTAIGLELTSPVEQRLSVHVASAAGALLFDRPYPAPGAQRVNFTLEAGAGVRIRTIRGQWLRAEYKYHHLSNAYFARTNPGLDAHMLSAGYEWAVTTRR